MLLDSMRIKGMDEDHYWWYLDVRRFVLASVQDRESDRITRVLVDP